MRQFTGLEYIKIATANAYGLDRENWDVRLDWFERHIGNLDLMAITAKEPIKYKKSVKAFWDCLNQTPTGFIMPLDATASGLQIFAAITGCKDTARNTNLLGGYDRMCPYANTAKTLSQLSHKQFDRDVVKLPLMTTFYGSSAQPKNIFGEDTEELNSFYDTLNIEFKGAVDALADIQSCWQSDADHHSWIMPDGHTVYIPVRDSETKVIEVDSLAGLRFTIAKEVVRPVQSGISLAANVIHSIDGYVCREMIRRAYKQGFRILTVHDEFWASPNRMNQVRQNYQDIMVELAESEILSDILSQICREEVQYQKFSLDLGSEIRKSEYHLS